MFTVTEIVLLVNVALGFRTAAECAPGDANGDGEITVDEIVAAVHHALYGCAIPNSPTATKTPFPAPTETPPATATETFPPTPTNTATQPPTPAATPSPTDSLIPEVPVLLRITVSGRTLFTTVGETDQFVAIAEFSDGREVDVTESAAWKSSDPSVATVSASGLVTAATSGTTTIRAVYGGQSGSLEVSVAIVPSLVRVLYVIPADREFRSDYAQAIASAIVDVQAWYREQLGGRTFSLFSAEPEVCRLPRPADWYVWDAWTKVFYDVQECAPVSYASRAFTWVLFVDVIHGCNAPGQLGRGTTGLTMLPQYDIEGLLGHPFIDDCGTEWYAPISRYVGGLAHEIGHAFGLPHPPDCDAGLPTCDANAIMWTGYLSYPAAHLLPEEKEILLASPFFQ